MTISDNLILLNSTKQDIKAAIEAKGVDMTDVPFTDYDTKIGEITTGATGPVITYDEWTRPSDWLTVPELTPTSEKVYILFAVNNVPQNRIRFRMAIADMIVDWGDGVVETIPSGNFAEHNYDYNSVQLNGTLTSRGYKQAIITITPVTTFANGTELQLNFTPTGYRTGTCVNVLEIHYAIANGSISLPKSSPAAGFYMCERINIKAWNPSVLTTMFAYNYALVIDIPFQRTSGAYSGNALRMFEYTYMIKAPLFDTSQITSMNYMFNNSEVQYVPEYNYSSCTNIAFMFSTATKLNYIGDMNIPNVTTMDSLFYYCESLINAPKLSNISSSVTNLDSMFGWNASLVYIPDGVNNNFSGVTNINTMFNSCYALKELPNWNFPSVTTMTTSAFTNCWSIKTIPNGYFSNASMTIAAPSLFSSCRSLTELPSTFANKTVITTMASMFNDCQSLRYIPPLNISANQLTGTAEYANVFRQCFSLVEIGTQDLTNNTGITGLANLFLQARSLQKINVIGLRITFTVADCNLGSAALDTLYTNLATVTGQTITVTGNPGTTGDNPAIATAKGWTVVG